MNVMTTSQSIILSGRYDREGRRTRVVIPEYRLGQCVNMTHWPEQPQRCLEVSHPCNLQAFSPFGENAWSARSAMGVSGGGGYSLRPCHHHGG